MTLTRTHRSAFVAAPHAAEFAQLLDTIQRSLAAHGYQALRIPSLPDSELIPALLDRVRNVDLVVAVLTGSRPNVYFELGVALGASLPAIVIAETTADLGMLCGFGEVILYGSRPEDIGPRLNRLLELRTSQARAAV